MNMNFTDVKYIKIDGTDTNGAIKFKIDGVDWSCNMTEGNRHYAAIIEWAEEDGNEIQAAE